MYQSFLFWRTEVATIRICNWSFRTKTILGTVIFQTKGYCWAIFLLLANDILKKNVVKVL